MAHQPLDNDETLNVRWATVDPNPAAQKREAARLEEQAAEAIRRALPASFVAELEGRKYDGVDPAEERKRRKIEGSFDLKGYEAPDHVWYAAEKARIESGGESKMIEGGQDQIDDEAEPEDDNMLSIGTASNVQNEPDGLLGASTLAALKGYRANNSGGTKAQDASAGPLVGYGSDSEDD
jgi:hypothetical protein